MVNRESALNSKSTIRKRLQHLSIIVALIGSLLSALTVQAQAAPPPPRTCQQGGICQVGDTGPGGGIVFYVAPIMFTQLAAAGSMCSTNCKYLEAAPTSGTNAWIEATYAWSGNTTNSVGATALGSDIGTGYANTLAIINQASGGEDVNKAGTITRAYRGPNNLDNWYLPSIDELAEMTNHIDTLGVLRSNAYWSSTEDASQAGDAEFGYFGTGLSLTKAKSNTFLVRPIRAFADSFTITLNT